MSRPVRFQIYSRRRFVLPLFLFAFALGLPALRFATSAAPVASAAPASSSPARAGMRVQIDPETGQLVPDTGTSPGSEAASGESTQQSEMSRSVVGLTVEMRSNGMQSVNLQGRFRESMVATTDASGRTRLGCLPAGEADRLVRGAGQLAPAPAPGTTATTVRGEAW